MWGVISKGLKQSISDYIKYRCLEGSERSWKKRFLPQTYSSLDKYSSNVCIHVCMCISRRDLYLKSVLLKKGKSQNHQLLTAIKLPSSKILQFWPVFVRNWARLGRSKEIRFVLCVSIHWKKGEKEVFTQEQRQHLWGDKSEIQRNTLKYKESN